MCEIVIGRETPFPSLADVGFLGFAAAAVVSIWLLPSRSGALDNIGSLSIAEALG